MDPKQVPENATAAPGSIELGGRTFLVSQPSPSDGLAVKKYIKKRIQSPLSMYAALAASPDFALLPEKVRHELASEAGHLQMQGDVSLSNELFAEKLLEPDCCAFLAWMLIRKRHPDVTLEALRALITDDNAAAVCDDLLRESGMQGEGPGGN